MTPQSKGPRRESPPSTARPSETEPAPPYADGPAVGETCDYCGSRALSWRKCKLICANCSQINKSCADL